MRISLHLRIKRRQRNRGNAKEELAADNISLGLVYAGVTATNYFTHLAEGNQPGPVVRHPLRLSLPIRCRLWRDGPEHVRRCKGVDESSGVEV
jgi:hypothetical protein